MTAYAALAPGAPIFLKVLLNTIAEKFHVAQAAICKKNTWNCLEPSPRETYIPHEQCQKPSINTACAGKN